MHPVSITNVSDELRELRQTLRKIKTPHLLEEQNPWLRSTAVRSRHVANPNGSVTDALCKVFEEALTQLKAEDPLSADLLHGRYWERLSVREMIGQGRPEPQSERRFHQQQNRALSHFSAILTAAQTVQHRQYKKPRHFAQIPLPTYDKLFGIASILERFVPLLAGTNAPYLISLEGMGGLGKTSLAHMALHQLADQHEYAGFHWFTLQEERLSPNGETEFVQDTPIDVNAIVAGLLDQTFPDDVGPRPRSYSIMDTLSVFRDCLNATPHLVVIDNFDTLADPGELLAALKMLSNPSRFLLISRAHQYEEIATHAFQLSELSIDSVGEFIQYESNRRNLPELQKVSDGELETIYKTVGGNPMALRLLIGELQVASLPTVIEDLRHARAQTSQNLYTYLYKTFWDRLSADSKRVLFTLAEIQEDEIDLLTIAEHAGEKPETIQSGLKPLIKFNLAQKRGDIFHARYAISNLTHTFLQNQAKQWDKQEQLLVTG